MTDIINPVQINVIDNFKMVTYGKMVTYLS